MSLKSKLQRLFDEGKEFLDLLSERWRKHANRRTSIAIILVAVIFTASYFWFVLPPDEFPIERLITVPEGATLSEIGTSLQQQGAIRSVKAFTALVFITGHERKLHAGDYLFKEPADLFAIARAIEIGAYGLEPIRFRVVEGATTNQMAVLFSALERFDKERFLAVARPEEGYLFPDTYFFLPNANDALIYKTLRSTFDRKIASITPEIASSTRTLSEIITMASILEREARHAEDRKKIAGVLWNRLARDMPLQVDAVFLYTLGKGTFQLTTADLTSDSPYNTYNRKGLPPTPIGSPSMNSIMAALQPIKSSYYYYLADSHGVTHYSKTYAEHLRKKAIYIGN